MAFKVFTDSAANLPTDILEEYGITAMPLFYIMDNTEYAGCAPDQFDGHEFYLKIKAGKMVQTSQVNPQKFYDHFEAVLSKGYDVIYISLAGGISNTLNSAKIAADLLKSQFPDRKVYCLDSMTASLGEGIPAIRAAECGRQGMSTEETVAFITELIKRTHSVFTVDDLMCLKRGGRLSNLAAAAGIMLHIKPILKGSEIGKIVNTAKVRGRKKSIEALAERYDRLVRNADQQTVGIAHADCAEDAAYLIELLNKKHPPKNILNVMYEPVTGAHVGPGALALFFESFDGVRLEN